MQQLTPQGQQAVQDLANRYNISVDATTAMLGAVANGGGTMAQFYIPELGGNGQWMQGGMTMVGDMFNTQLQYTVSNLCGELSGLLRNQQMFVPAPINSSGGGMNNMNNWWPSELGQPSSSGGQNDSKYAIFPHAQRLAIKKGQDVTVYDTLDHQIGGVQQQSGSHQPLSFSSQFGTFDLNSLPLANQPQVAHNEPNLVPAPMANSEQDNYQPSNTVNDTPVQDSGSNILGSNDIFRALEQLGQLHQMGILSSSEFENKKQELLARL